MKARFWDESRGEANNGAHVLAEMMLQSSDAEFYLVTKIKD